MPGPIGVPRFATVHGGETVVPYGKRGGEVTVVYQQNAPVYGFSSFEDSVVAAVEMGKRRGRI